MPFYVNWDRFFQAIEIRYSYAMYFLESIHNDISLENQISYSCIGAFVASLDPITQYVYF